MLSKIHQQSNMIHHDHSANTNSKHKPSSPYHVVADKPLMYETQSKTPNSWRARRLPNIAVMDLTPPAVVMTATTGTCSTHKQSVLHHQMK